MGIKVMHTHSEPLEMTQGSQYEALIGREEELRRLHAAIRRRESLLIWGATDAGKSALIKTALAELPEGEQRNCVYWTGAARGRQLLSYFLAQLYRAGDSLVQRKVRVDGAGNASLDRWLQKQSSLRLRGIFFTASTRGKYRFFLDHFPCATHNMARLMKEIMYRCETPIYLAARGYSQSEIGYAWSLYWNDKLRLHLGPLTERAARRLLETCVRKFGFASRGSEDFREDILRLSGHLPGSIVKMCELAADSKYHCGDQIKTKLVHIDYLMRTNLLDLGYGQVAVP